MQCNYASLVIVQKWCIERASENKHETASVYVWHDKKTKQQKNPQKQQQQEQQKN